MSAAAPRPAAPSAPAEPFAPRLDHHGFAVMRIGGETLVVHLTRVEPGRPGRAVGFSFDHAAG